MFDLQSATVVGGDKENNKRSVERVEYNAEEQVWSPFKSFFCLKKVENLTFEVCEFASVHFNF